MIWQFGAHCWMLRRYGSHISTHAASIPRRCLALSSVWKYPSKLSFFRSRRNHNGSPVSRLHTTLRQNQAGIDFEVRFSFVGLRLRAGTLARFDGYLLARQRE
jgi:hypothetical protein